MKVKNMFASAVLCLMLVFATFAGDTPITGRACDPNVEECPAAATNSNSVLNSVVAVISQIVILIK